MSKRLKCPNCYGHTAYLSWGFNERTGRRFKQKHCGDCGYHGPKQYYGGYLTKTEYDVKAKQIRQKITERLKADELNSKTEGNWKIARDTDTDSNTLVIGSDGGVIADTYCNWRKKELCESNACLIASSPEMYEALIAWGELVAMRPLDSGADIDDILTRCDEITDKALAKAEGR